MDLHSQKITKFPKKFKQLVCSAAVPKLLCHLES